MGATSSMPLDGLAESWCKTGFKVVKCRYVWVIENFSFCEMKAGEFLESSSFSVDLDNKELRPNPKWSLALYPKGENEDSKDYLALYIRLDRDSAAVNAQFEFAILDAQNQQHYYKKSGNHKFTHGERCGYKQFVRRRYLEIDGLFPNDRLTILCVVSMAAGSVNVTGQCSKMTHCQVPQLRLSEDFGALLEKGLFTDFVLCSDGQEFKAHKNVLACRSPVFAAMFSNDTEEKRTNRVEIEDISAPVLGQLLHFIYTGQVPTLGQDMAEGLLAAADKYQLDRLKAMCERQLSAELTKENACAVLALADLHNAEQLKTCAIEYISLHADEVVETDGWRQLVAPGPLRQLFKLSLDKQIRPK